MAKNEEQEDKGLQRLTREACPITRYSTQSLMERKRRGSCSFSHIPRLHTHKRTCLNGYKLPADTSC
eukprot:scaffold572332_cov63-Attheya_sp.AAC.2